MPLGPSDDYTYVQGRERMYEWLPPFEGPFKSAFRENDRNVVSFHLANSIRKYGEAYEGDDYVSRMIPRLAGGASTRAGRSRRRANGRTRMLSFLTC